MGLGPEFVSLPNVRGWHLLVPASHKAVEPQASPGTSCHRLGCVERVHVGSVGLCASQNVSLETSEFQGVEAEGAGMCIPLYICVGPWSSVGGSMGECHGFWLSHWSPCLLDLPQSSALSFYSESKLMAPETQWS